MNQDSTGGYISKEYLTKRFLDKEIFIYGIGIDSEAFLKDYDHRITVKGFVDSYRHGNVYLGRNVISPETYTEEFREIPCVIMAARYALEIKAKLEGLGLIFGTDFFIYDNNFYFHADKNIEDFIKFNENRWTPWKVNKENDKSIVLMPFDTRHSAYDMLRAAYVANYYAKETNSPIYAYIRLGGHYIDASENFKRIYRSLNVVDVIDDTLSEEQKRRVRDLSENIWSSIHTWADWKSITVNGICFGTTIIRHMMRHFLPSLDADDDGMRPFLEIAIGYIVFWLDYFNNHDVKLVLLGDGVCWDGYIRDIALHHGIRTYNTILGFSRMTEDFNYGTMYPFFKSFWNRLTLQEKQKGLEYARRMIKRRIRGEDKMLDDFGNKNIFSSERHEKVLTDSNRTKILICPHIFEEDSYCCGDFLFDNSYISWIVHLGELSKQTPDYDWYLKIHPTASKRDFIILDKFFERYPSIKRIEAYVSPLQLKEEGVSVALTIYGTISYEYPLIGIDVINAGNNPGISFDFAYNPRTIEEYDSLILNLQNLKHKRNIEEIYQFYALNNMYYDWDSLNVQLNLVDNFEFYKDRYQLQAIGLDDGTWKYKVYMDECTDERHEALMKSIPDVLAKADSWRPDVFYKKKLSENLL